MFEEADRLEKAEEEWFSKSSEIMKESAVVWTPLGEVVVPQLQKIGEHHDWKETEHALSIYGKTGKYAIALYYVLSQAGHDHAERMIDVVVPNETIGRKIQSFFRIITGMNLPWGNIYVCDPSEEWGPESVSEDVYANEEVEPLIPGLFEPRAVEPEEDGKRKMNLSLEPFMEYDVVVGNPPYQKNERTKIWPDFVRKSEMLTRNGGCFSLIHPGSWKTYAAADSSSLLRDIFQKNNIIYLEVGTAAEYFSVNSSFDWYVIEKGDPKSDVRVITTDSELEFDINSLPCVPSRINEESLSITKKVVETGSKLDLIKNRELDTYNTDFVADNKDSEHTYPVRHTKLTETEVKWSSKEHSVQNEKKILLTISGYIRPEYDTGKYGVTQHALYIEVKNKEEADYVLSLLESNLYTYFRQVNKWHGFHHLYLLREMPYVKGLDTDNIDEELYDHFNLSDDEIKEIEQFL